MIEFVDIKDGRVFNGDKPYVFWFENGQSVNLNYVRKICFISTDRIVPARIESDTFALLNMGQDIPEIYNPDDQGEIINEKLYMDLERLKTNRFTSNGSPYNNFYVHMIYVLASSRETGEIHDSLYLTDSEGEHEYEIAADFYGDNEILKTNLSNFDIHIPESIQKAIYDVDVHEESNDNITLNRKYKELLMNYWDIVANKGSYNSLQNSLAWFEWGDLVRIEEFWKRHHEGMEEYFLTDLNHELDYEFITEFLNNSKTTYIGLYMALDKICMENGQPRYDDESNPVLEPVITKWQLIDLCLKMTLLGNFYSTYFTPIHIDTIHSTLEHWVFSYTMKVIHAECVDNYVSINNIHTFDMVYDKRVKMMEHNNKAYSDTLFGNHIDNGSVFGFEGEIREEPKPAFTSSGEVFRYHMGGTYGVVHFRVTEDNPILAYDENDHIYREILHWETEGEIGSITTFVPITPVCPTYIDANTGEEKPIRDGRGMTSWMFLPEFELGFMNPGHYTLTFQFDTICGNTWTKTVEVEIEDTTYNHVNLYKVIKRNDANTFYPTIVNASWDAGLNWFKSFQINHAVDNERDFEYREHNVFLESFYGDWMNVNHTVIFDIPRNISAIKFNNHTTINVSGYNREHVFEALNANMQNYIWIVSNCEPTDEDPTPVMRVVGVCRYYGTTEDPQHPFIKIITDGNNTELRDVFISFKFHPFMHVLIPLTSAVISNRDLIYAIPHLGHSRDIRIRNWVFENKSTGEKFESYLTSQGEPFYEDDHSYNDGKIYNDRSKVEDYGGMQGWFITPQERMKLKPGYYNIKLQYSKGENLQEFNINSAFLLEK